MKSTKPISQYQQRIFVAVVAHALPHRRLGARIAWDLMNNVVAAKQQKRRPYLTHCHLAKRRGVMHRNTSRDLLAELQELGLVQAKPYQAKQGITFRVQWGAIYRYAKENDVQPMRGRPPAAVRTKAAWDAERAAWRQRNDEKREAADQADRQAKAAQAAAYASRSDEQMKAERAAGLLKSVQEYRDAGRDVPATLYKLARLWGVTIPAAS